MCPFIRYSRKGETIGTENTAVVAGGGYDGRDGLQRGSIGEVLKVRKLFDNLDYVIIGLYALIKTDRTVH